MKMEILKQNLITHMESYKVQPLSIILLEKYMRQLTMQTIKSTIQHIDTLKQGN